MIGKGAGLVLAGKAADTTFRFPRTCFFCGGVIPTAFRSSVKLSCSNFSSRLRSGAACTANALMLPHVIAYNASVVTKFMPPPYTKGYVAHKRYATVADLLGLRGHNTDEKVKNPIAATEQLLHQLAFPRSIAERGNFESRI